MSVLSQEEFLKRIQSLVGEDTTDEAMHTIEDFTDTYNTLSAKPAGEDWKQKYTENDEMWRKKYRDRFFSTGEQVKEEQNKDVQEDGREITFSDLFKEREG
jgi:hypothetical protein